MTLTAFLLAVLKALPALLALLSAIRASADAKANQGLGYDEAVAAALRVAEQDHVTANAARALANLQHAAHPNDDTGFDPDFQRKD